MHYKNLCITVKYIYNFYISENVLFIVKGINFLFPVQVKTFDTIYENNDIIVQSRMFLLNYHCIKIVIYICVYQVANKRRYMFWDWITSTFQNRYV